MSKTHNKHFQTLTQLSEPTNEHKNRKFQRTSPNAIWKRKLLFFGELLRSVKMMKMRLCYLALGCLFFELGKFEIQK